MTAHRPVRNSCASLAGLVLSFIACFILLVIATLRLKQTRILLLYTSEWDAVINPHFQEAATKQYDKTAPNYLLYTIFTRDAVVNCQNVRKIENGFYNSSHIVLIRPIVLAHVELRFSDSLNLAQRLCFLSLIFLSLCFS